MRNAPAPAACFYVEGRTDAADGFDANDYDLDALLARALAGDDLREVCKQAIAADLATDAHDGTKDAWLAEHEEEAEECGVEPSVAYEEWCRGYMDRGAFELETCMEDMFDDAVDEITAVETPAATMKKFARVTKAPKTNPLPDRGATYGDWYANGIKDCQNAWDATALDDELNAAAAKVTTRMPADKLKTLAEDAVHAYWTYSEENGSKGEWERHNAEDVKHDGLNVEKAYKEWAAGWREQAKSYAIVEIAKRAAALADD